MDHRTDGDIERPLADGGDLLARTRTFHRSSLTGAGLPWPAVAAEAVQLALLVEVAHDRIEGVNSGKSGLGLSGCGGRILGVQYDLKRHGHFDAGELEAMHRRLAGRSGRHARRKQPRNDQPSHWGRSLPIEIHRGAPLPGAPSVSHPLKGHRLCLMLPTTRVTGNWRMMQVVWACAAVLMLAASAAADPGKGPATEPACAAAQAGDRHSRGQCHRTRRA